MMNIAEVKSQYLYLYANCIPVKGYVQNYASRPGKKNLYFIATAIMNCWSNLKKLTIGKTNSSCLRVKKTLNNSNYLLIILSRMTLPASWMICLFSLH